MIVAQLHPRPTEPAAVALTCLGACPPETWTARGQSRMAPPNHAPNRLSSRGQAVTIHVEGDARQEHTQSCEVGCRGRLPLARRRVAEITTGPCSSPAAPVSLGATRTADPRPYPYAPVPLFPADSARGSEGGRDRLSPADAARRHAAAGGGGHLCLASPRGPRAQEDRTDRAG